MIKLTRLNNEHLVLNCQLIEIVEATPDTVITLTTGKKFLVKDSVDDVIERVVSFKRQYHNYNIHEGRSEV